MSDVCNFSMPFHRLLFQRLDLAALEDAAKARELADIEHALYGDLAFTLGLGVWIYTGAARQGL